MSRSGRATPSLLLVVGLGGALGALLRWGATGLAPAESGFPWATFTINVLGCLALGLLPLLVTGQRGALFLGPGLLGGFTTMSTCSDQARALLAGGHAPVAIAYLLGTLLAAVVAVNLAGLVGGRLGGPPRRGAIP